MAYVNHDFYVWKLHKKNFDPPPKHTLWNATSVQVSVSSFRCFSDGEYSTDTNVGCQIDFFF